MKNLIVICICLLAYFQSLGQSEYSSSVINIGVVVSDLDSSMDFYQNILGMIKVNLYDITPEMGSKTGLSDGIPFKAEVLKVEDSPNATEWKLMSFGEKPQHPKQKWIHDDTGMQYITLMVKSLAPFIERLKENEIPLLGETPTPLSDTMSFVLIQDPDGNFVELIGPLE